jgi:hypothetical protein
MLSARGRSVCQLKRKKRPIIGEQIFVAFLAAYYTRDNGFSLNSKEKIII